MAVAGVRKTRGNIEGCQSMTINYVPFSLFLARLEMPPQNYGGQSGYDYDQQHHYQRQQDQQHHDPYNQRNPYDRQQDYNT